MLAWLESWTLQGAEKLHVSLPAGGELWVAYWKAVPSRKSEAYTSIKFRKKPSEEVLQRIRTLPDIKWCPGPQEWRLPGGTMDIRGLAFRFVAWVVTGYYTKFGYKSGDFRVLRTDEHGYTEEGIL